VARALQVSTAILKSIRAATGSQCRSASTGVICSYFEVDVTIRAAVFVVELSVKQIAQKVNGGSEASTHQPGELMCQAAASDMNCLPRWDIAAATCDLKLGCALSFAS